MVEACRNCTFWNGAFLVPKAVCHKDTQYKNWNDSCESYRDNPKLAHTQKKQNAYQPEREE